MAFSQSNPIRHEMLMDLCYRLRLADDLLDLATDSLVDAMTLEDFAAKRRTIEQIHAYAQALQLIYADFRHLIDDCHVTFPTEPVLWQWNEPRGEEVITTVIERLHDIADGLRLKLNAALDHQENHA